MNKTQTLGNAGETLVAQQLISQGFTLLAKNYRRRTGEVDLIASKKDIIAFVEVKTRKNKYFDLSTVITRSKQRKIIMAAKEYLVRHDHYDKVCRFDVALVENGNQITYIPNAFTE
ncbi:YraN family protein [Candidatus Dependentiae bacterium]|nr:YraN family protein [Candidatus Dependentiae bacterium]